MHDTLTPVQARDMLSAVARHLVANVDMLTQVDQAIGDGDHGIGMRRGFSAVEEAMASTEPVSVSAVFKAAGTAIMAKTGGAAGAIFGTMFRSGSAAFDGQAVLNAEGFAGFLALGLEGVEKRGAAKPGQKTMIDALAPAATAAKTAIARGLVEVVKEATDAAKGGVEATKDMIATTGKARTLGERSLGHPDPGAVSMSLILEAMRDYIAA
ncbi:dihydroxyacetone kinase subunit DhaL [Pleomorphomonas sp. JP5]|uniref:dihydroxyacetone kinase subunit DhaL n=1 Tax=Pleomorphomonas sp. JP5 TaxID=2942998 RepID=UPI002043404E|nr:dihydroxyacetone kinase subunit DhaL [Pleomorphomonas sp. JP5]MCM5559202.1 dihydroxyacetone kinase subunit DhaL [Pleomorphomonas sp. JP5]